MSRNTKTFIKLALIAFAIIVVAYACVGGETIPVPKPFIATLHQMEASGQVGVIKGYNDNGDASGPLQIHYAYWLDAGVGGSYEQCTNFDYSVKVVTGYLNRYARKYLHANNYEALARIHVGGPQGYRKQNTIAYWRRFEQRMSRPVARLYGAQAFPPDAGCWSGTG